jgi:transcriptional regulator with XRE-family HTH domain
MDSKIAFAQRLTAAMRAAGLEPRPSVLLDLFNSRYWGRSVTFQAVSRWLKGEAFPAQDKLIVLSELLKISPDELRYGKAVVYRPQTEHPHQPLKERPVGYLERDTFDAFMQLPVQQRKLIREVILTFARVHNNQPDLTEDASLGQPPQGIKTS